MKLNIFNPTSVDLTIFEVGLFRPGDNIVDLNDSDIAILKNNNVIIVKKIKEEKGIKSIKKLKIKKDKKKSLKYKTRTIS